MRTQLTATGRESEEIWQEEEDWAKQSRCTREWSCEAGPE
jgi:hypothetical protein